MSNHPSRNRTIHLLLGSLLFVICLSLTAVATDFGDITVNIETVLTSHSDRGYVEYRAIVTNRSSTTSHRVTVGLFADIYSGYLNEVEREVEVAPSSSASVSLFSPAQHTGRAAYVLIDGSRQKNPVLIDNSRTAAWTSRSQNRLFLLVSREIEKSGLMNSEPVTEGFKHPSGENDVAYIAYQSHPSDWSANWIGYSGLDGVVVTADEMRAMPRAARDALVRYVECGGVAVVTGQWEVPDQWRARRTPISEAKSHPDVDDASRGTIILKGGTAQVLHEQVGNREGEEAASGTRMELKNKLETFSVGFGKILVTGAVAPKQITESEWRFIKILFEDSRPPDQHYYNLSQINKNFPVIERIGIPVRGLFTLMLAFVILIGPINLFWLARPGKKIRMLWTVPAISLLTCLAVAGFALFGEGVNATTRTEAFTILDETAHRATTIGWIAFYSPVTPSEGLHFSQETELIPQNPDWRGTGGRVIDYSNDQHLASGWIAARVPVYFKFRKSETRRERLIIRPSGRGVFSVVNGLGADVEKLWFADRSGRIYSSEKIAAGAQATLSDTGSQATGGADTMRELFGTPDWIERMKFVNQNQAQFLTPGTYLAVLDRSPFVEPGLKDETTHKARTVVFGFGVEVAR